MAHDIQDDRRIDPRIKALLAHVPAVPASTATTREELLADGTAVESPVAREDLASEAVFIGNSARGLLSARLVGDPQIA